MEHLSSARAPCEWRTVFVNTTRDACRWMTCGLISVPAFNTHAMTVVYTLDNIVLGDGEQITGSFDWTFSLGDFEGGSGDFTELEIPHTIYSLGDGNLALDIQTKAIEISGDGNFHDVGLDITIVFAQPLTYM